jgi:hypothetical protein
MDNDQIFTQNFFISNQLLPGRRDPDGNYYYLVNEDGKVMDNGTCLEDEWVATRGLRVADC